MKNDKEQFYKYGL